ncbi:maleylpyruvate isomerase family mycothiol-dependent enzyme [Nocardioides sp.]|uniref:maleylpyruvate isomerase family mycothiol-dependent enzyme n=1 Tax=Nocardioides sp. TaxID=35761 RepID=UPI0026141FB6|nr:maleylpyruvate isomerase family mycothiol-dependent enzyme [Nocardioides sp.]MDI6911964.1 maleylpyruvate isomerase family mycothiol-dependent enzyme [Nocardioides sp.]
MTRLAFDDYLGHLREDSGRFRAVLTGCDPAARVPGCPEWTAADLLWHLTEVQQFWARIVRDRPTGPSRDWVEPQRPASYDALLAAFDEHSAALAAALEAADPAEPAWSWSEEQTVGFTFRRQAHEALIHRLDAEQTAGDVSPLDPELAADGVDEALAVMFGGTPPWGTFTGLPQYVRVDLTDRDESVWVQVGHFTGTDPESGTHHDGIADVSVVPDPGGEPDVVVDGPAGAIDAWLWRRGDDREIRVAGDRAVYDHFRRAVDQPLD